jgi:putative colanic acid biosynthesis acetyltransferase WcaF
MPYTFSVLRNLSLFSPGSTYKRPHMLRIIAWTAVQNTIFKLFFIPSRFRVFILKLFGSAIGRNVIIKRGVRVHFPWNLIIGNDCWIGEEVWFINHEKITIGSDVCISQRAIICSSGHDYRSTSLDYAHRPIRIKDGAWVCLDAKVLAGVSIGECSVVSAGEIVRKSIPDYSLLSGGEVKLIDAPK